MADHLSAVMAMLGPAPNRYADPAAWDRLHAELGTPQGLWPIASTDRGETVFLVAAGTAAPWLLVEDGEERWARYDMGFAEWLHRYLIGEDMGGPNSSVYYPGPVRLCRLPMTVDERPEPWSGPDRGM